MWFFRARYNILKHFFVESRKKAFHPLFHVFDLIGNSFDTLAPYLDFYSRLLMMDYPCYYLCLVFDRESLLLTHRMLSQYLCSTLLMFPWNGFHILWQSTKTFHQNLLNSRELLTYSFTTFLWHDSLINHITFITENHSLDIFIRMLVNIPQPLDYILETFLICYVVNQHNSHCTSIIRSCDCMKTFLSSGLWINIKFLSSLTYCHHFYSTYIPYL